MKIKNTKYFFIVLMLVSLILFSCFSTWQEGTGTFSIRIGGADNASANSARSLTNYDGFYSWPNAKVNDVWYRITVSTGLGADDVRHLGLNINLREHTERYEVNPGLYEITVEAFDRVAIDDGYEDVLYGIGSESITITAGANIDVNIEMKKPEFTVNFQIVNQSNTTISNIPAGKLLNEVVNENLDLDSSNYTWTIRSGNDILGNSLNIPVFKNMTVRGGLQVEMIWIPGGNFQRDSSTVTLTGFNMSKYQVTQELYEAVMGSNPSYFSSSPATGEIQGRRPVETVSWYDAIVFCNRLSIMEDLSPAYSINGSTNPDTWGAIPTDWNTTWNAVTIVSGSTGYRLPTEAQWEYACRAGATTTYYWGDEEDYATVDQYAWYWENSNDMTHEVGLKQPNAFGLYDMSGNVWEWCWDWYDTYPSGDQADPVGASSGSYRVFRGGNWFGNVGGLQSADRDGYDPSDRGSDIGFRVLRP